MTDHKREAAERFAALVAHPFCHSIAFFLADASQKNAGKATPWGRELIYIATALVDARARARGRA